MLAASVLVPYGPVVASLASVFLSLFSTKPSSAKALEKTDIYDMVTAALKDHALSHVVDIKPPAMLNLMGDLGDQVQNRNADSKNGLDVDWFVATKEKLHKILGYIDELYMMIGHKINGFNAISETCEKICPNRPRSNTDKDATCKDKLKTDEGSYALLKKAEKAFDSAVVLYGVRSFELSAMYEKCVQDRSGCKLRTGVKLLHSVKKHSQDLIAMAASQQEKLATYHVSKDGMHPTTRTNAGCKSEFAALMSPQEKCDKKRSRVGWVCQRASSTAWSPAAEVAAFSLRTAVVLAPTILPSMLPTFLLAARMK
ncbi:unnamed protein product [Polarella glacialis]|uniref:Uncharacterized protein n=1 Tax=Polarella glacialis TaxID=89957 RepID=A0A813KM21_POLGL|nr:unnamed protein product [Polarella glacialis]